MDDFARKLIYQSKPGLTARIPSSYSSFSVYQNYRAGFAHLEYGWWFFGSCLYYYWEGWYSPWVNIWTYGV